MGFDARREDYLRLSLRFGRTLDGMAPGEAARAFADFGRRFARDYDSLPQTDADRAFHLVSKATRLIDYELPFAGEREAPGLIERGHGLLEEALSLDPHCHDARRMLAASEQMGFDAYYQYLTAGESEVAARCREEHDAAMASADERGAIAGELALRPHQRWLATMVAQALICGRNREALRVCARALAEYPADDAGVRQGAAFAYAKLEDEQGLDALVASDCLWAGEPYASGAWVLLARAALAYKRHEMGLAVRHLERILALYPHACAALIRQHEFPEGVFARLTVPPRSEDELALALSEAAILLQEGRELEGRGSFGAWVAREAQRRALPSEASEVADALRYAAERAALIRQEYEGGGERA